MDAFTRGLINQPYCTFWIIVPTEEIARFLVVSDEVMVEMHAGEESFNFQWDPQKVQMETNDLAIVCMPKEPNEIWSQFIQEICIPKTRLFTFEKHDLHRHTKDCFRGFCELIRLVRKTSIT